MNYKYNIRFIGGIAGGFADIRERASFPRGLWLMNAMSMRQTLLPAIFLLVALPGHAQQAQLPLIELFAGMHRIEAEVAATGETRQIGMMLRTSMPVHRGMLFVFTEDARHCMWMRNTLLPLSVAFLDEKGRILNIEEMQPKTEDNHCAQKPARYALEMNAGWFKARGLGVGFSIGGIDKAPAAR